jgi:uncharacterized protein with von Willebrand factor type A (vWA) domain
VADFGVETVWLDLPAVAGAFGRRLHELGLPVGTERSTRFAQALALVAPVSRRRLYWTARAVFASDPGQVADFDAVFAAVFGGLGAGGPGAGADGGAGASGAVVSGAGAAAAAAVGTTRPGLAALPRAEREAASGRTAPTPRDLGSAGAASAARTAVAAGQRSPAAQVPVPIAPSDEEILRAKRFDALEPGELAELYRLMSRLEVAPPERRTRRTRRDRHGERIDLRRTLRASLRTGGDPIRLARRRRRIMRRRMVLLCDISGSMEPYARAYLQFLTCAAGGGARTEAFVFATRLTRLTPLTRTIASRDPERAIARAAAAAPDWSSGTRIGDALKTFNDRHGRRGMARGAVIVILSDGWELHDPQLVGREMQRLGRLAHRIVWVNPRAGSRGFAPRTSGMAAALPHCDALVSGHSLEALEEVVVAIGGGGGGAARGGPDGVGARGAGRDRVGGASRGRIGRASRDRLGGASRGGGAGAGPTAPSPPEPERWPSATPVAGSSVAMPSGYGPSRGRTTPGWGTDA